MTALLLWWLSGELILLANRLYSRKPPLDIPAFAREHTEAALANLDLDEEERRQLRDRLYRVSLAFTTLVAVLLPVFWPLGVYLTWRR
jgi:hypothetical protein